MHRVVVPRLTPGASRGGVSGAQGGWMVEIATSGQCLVVMTVGVVGFAGLRKVNGVGSLTPHQDAGLHWVWAWWVSRGFGSVEVVWGRIFCVVRGGWRGVCPGRGW